ncbi:MAG: acylneuraminate cytidylyltransferase [Anaerolineae bacterium]|nr:acylneuraminate cytidylyltransferase [Anaerolineae bacterium]
MVDRPEVLAVIPARGGSKGLLRKNVYDFAGFPLISYSIAAARQSTSVTRTIVTTDDGEIAAVAKEYGAEVPFLRPAELAQDTTLDLPVFQHALRWLAEHENYIPDLVIQLRPTSPIRPIHLVDTAVQMMQTHPEAESLRGVVPAGQNPFKMWLIDPESGLMQPLKEVPGMDEPYNTARQLLPQAYWQTGHIDVIRPHVILAKNQMSGSPILPLKIDPRYTVDIDNLETLLKAEELVWSGTLEMVHPRQPRRPLPPKVDLVVLDFDGTMTDDRVWVREDGFEMVAAHRGDGLGISALRKNGIRVIVVSKERNPVVSARCRKLNLPVIQGVDDKAALLANYFEEHEINPQHTIYMGNDINDVPCFPLVAYAVVVADAEPPARRNADRVLTRSGGHGAVRELCEIILRHLNLPDLS